MFIILIYIFPNSYPTSTPHTSLGHLLRSFFFEKFTPNLSLDVLIKSFLQKKNNVETQLDTARQGETKEMSQQGHCTLVTPYAVLHKG